MVGAVALETANLGLIKVTTKFQFARLAFNKNWVCGWWFREVSDTVLRSKLNNNGNTEGTGATN
jgi:hypothetical protein